MPLSALEASGSEGYRPPASKAMSGRLVNSGIPGSPNVTPGSCCRVVAECRGDVVSGQFNVLVGNEKAILELLAINPVSYFPPLHRPTVGKLSELGCLRHDGDCWYPTAVGLGLIGRAIH